MDSKQAAESLGMSTNARHKRTAARTIPFEQDCADAARVPTPGGGPVASPEAIKELGTNGTADITRNPDSVSPRR